MDRIILHCDCNCFYASCELLSHPDLRQLPVAVCGDPTERHGIILAKNEPAKRCGVKTAETIWKAKQKCPGLILLPPHHRLYAEYSKKINAVYGEYTDLVEPFGIDESWLDVTNSLHLFGGDARALADTLRGRIRREFGLTISVGVSFNKVFAKLGSDYKKPDATTVIARDNWRDIVFPLPVGDLLFGRPQCTGVAGPLRRAHDRRTLKMQRGNARNPDGQNGLAALPLCQRPRRLPRSAERRTASRSNPLAIRRRSAAT